MLKIISNPVAYLGGGGHYAMPCPLLGHGRKNKTPVCKLKGGPIGRNSIVKNSEIFPERNAKIFV